MADELNRLKMIHYANKVPTPEIVAGKKLLVDK
jgi:hypothetical protein